MKIHYITTTDNLEEITIAKATYKRENSIITRLAKEANKLFGENNWEQVPNYDNSLNNLIGWYARLTDGDQTIDARPASWEDYI